MEPFAICVPWQQFWNSFGEDESSCFCRDRLLKSTFPAPLPVPNATLDGLEAPFEKLKISMYFSAPFFSDSPSIPSNFKKISTATFSSPLCQCTRLLLGSEEPG